MEEDCPKDVEEGCPDDVEKDCPEDVEEDCPDDVEEDCPEDGCGRGSKRLDVGEEPEDDFNSTLGQVQRGSRDSSRG